MNKNQVLASKNAQKNNYELIDNGQFKYGYKNLGDGELYAEISDELMRCVFCGENYEGSFIVYEGESRDKYTLSVTYDWAKNELDFLVFDDEKTLHFWRGNDMDEPIYDKLQDMLKWLGGLLLDIDYRETVPAQDNEYTGMMDAILNLTNKNA